MSRFSAPAILTPQRIAALLLVPVLLCLTPGARSQGTGERAGNAAQYVLLIDDSGSMRPIGRDPGADPDRLSVFAARSMLALLDDSDEVSVVRLNAVMAGEQPPAIRPLREVRSGLEAALANEGPIAQYAGRDTPCSRAFEAVRTRLNEARRPGVRQVLVYLTDGVCEINRRPDPVDAQSFLSGVDSHRNDSAFLFYLLRFRGRAFTPALEDIARRTGGAAFEMTAEATGILTPFAQAFSLAQGFDAFEVGPASPTIPAHSAASRVRLLAVAEGTGPPLRIGFRGAAPTLLGESRTGVHRFGSQRTFRYATLDYRPGLATVDVTVDNAGTGWKIVAIPEYHMRVETSVLGAACAEGGSEVQSVEVGGSACVRLRLVNQDGEPIDTASFGGRVELAVGYRGPASSTEQVLPVGGAPGGAIAGTLERARLEAGDHVFRPRATVTLTSGIPFTLFGRPRTLQATTARISSSIPRWNIGELVPGASQFTDVVLSGNFPRVPGTFSLTRNDGFPQCVRFTLSSVEEGASIPLVDGQSYRLGVLVDGVCSLTPVRRDLSASVRIVAPGLPPLEIPVTASLVADIHFPTEIEVRADRQRSVTVPITIAGNQLTDFHLFARLAEPGEGWPGQNLSLGLVGGREGEARRDGSGALARSGEITVSRAQSGPSTAALWASVNPCCGAGTYRTELTLAIRGSETETARIPVRVIVTEGTWWGCHGETVRRVLIGIAAFLVLWFLRNMYVNTHFINRDALQKAGGLPQPEYEYDADADERPARKPALRNVPSWLGRRLAWLGHGGFLAGFGRRFTYREVWRLEPEHFVGDNKELHAWTVALRPPVRHPAKTTLGKGDALYVVASGPSGGGSSRQSIWVSYQPTDAESTLSLRGELFEVAVETPNPPGDYVHVIFTKGVSLRRAPTQGKRFAPGELMAFNR